LPWPRSRRCACSNDPRQRASALCCRASGGAATGVGLCLTAGTGRPARTTPRRSQAAPSPYRCRRAVATESCPGQGAQTCFRGVPRFNAARATHLSCAESVLSRTIASTPEPLRTSPSQMPTTGSSGGQRLLTVSFWRDANCRSDPETASRHSAGSPRVRPDYVSASRDAGTVSLSCSSARPMLTFRRARRVVPPGRAGARSRRVLLVCRSGRSGGLGRCCLRSRRGG
jgi:hypothetical protein